MQQINKIYLFNAIVANKVLYFIALLFICYQLFVYKVSLIHRPMEIFNTNNYFQNYFVQKLPSEWLYYSVAFAGVLLCIWILIKPQVNYNWLRKLILVFILFWINAIRWSYGYFSHVSHLFLLSVFLSAFLGNISLNKETLNKFKWYYSTLLFTYALSAFWKIYYVVYNMVTNHAIDDWRAAFAIEYNAACGHIYTNSTFKLQHIILQYDFFWELMFWGMTIFMLSAFILVRYNKLFRWVILGLVVFHLSNTFFIHAIFWLAPLLLLSWAFPYHKVFKSAFKKFSE